MPNRELDALIKSRNKAFQNAQAIIDKRLAEMYLDAYKVASDELSQLMLTIEAEENKLLAAAKYKRLENLQSEIASEYRKLTGRAINVTGESTAQAMVSGYHGSEWSFNMAIKQSINFGMLPIDTIRASVFSEASGLTFIKTFAKNATVELADIQAVITRGLANGWSYKRIAQAMKDKYERGLADAMRVARTEAGRAYSEGQYEAHLKAQELGIKTRRVWDAALDGRTRPSHGAADGQVADGKDQFTVGGYKFKAPRLPVGDAPLGEIINCRCAAVEELIDYPPEYRNIGGEDMPYQTYADWAAPFGWTPEKGWPQGAQAYKSGLRKASRR